MSDTLYLPNARVPWVNQDGTLTTTAVRALNLLFQRVGGARGDTGDDVFAALESGDNAAETVTAVRPADSVADTVAFAQAPERVAEIVTQPRAAQEAFPVGFVLVTTVSADPATYLGYGTWTATSSGFVPVGYLPGDPDFGTPGAVTGTKTKAISVHAGTAVADHANHTHSFTSSGNAGSPHLVTQDLVTGVAPGGTTGGVNATLTHSVTQPSNHADLNVVQPSMTFYMFERTA